MPTLHVVVPVYNEKDTLEACLRRVVAVALPSPWTMRLELVDDCSEPDAAARTRDLADRGATIHIGHRADNISSGRVVVSSDIQLDNVELEAAEANLLGERIGTCRSRISRQFEPQFPFRCCARTSSSTPARSRSRALPEPMLSC